jgi:uncharacterized damage-inducible protein DinB
MTLSDRFRKWFDYERDCNAKAVAMLESVPDEKRSDLLFAKALTKFGHCFIARQMWLFRLGLGPAAATPFPTFESLEHLKELQHAIEAAWAVQYAHLTDDMLAKEFDYTGWDNKRYRLRRDELLMQLFGHAWYHRGQVAMIVSMLGGKAVDTDYILWPGAGRVKLDE